MQTRRWLIHSIAAALAVLLTLAAVGANAQWPQPQPPVPPEVRLVTGPNTITIHFNGLMPEAFPDTVTGVIDFEGYRIYMSYQSGSNADLVLMEQYDLEDYNKYIWRDALSIWERWDNPYTLEELRCAYGTSCDDATFDPLVYTSDNPLIIPDPLADSIIYFAMVFENLSNLDPPGIHKRFPGQPYPTSLNPAEALPTELTSDGYLKYFDYEFVIDDVMGGVDVWISVTTLDIGVYQIAMPATESDPSESAQLLSVEGGCCVGTRGNFVTEPGSEDEMAGPIDLSFLVDFLFSGGVGPQCDDEGDYNADGAVADPVDLSYFVDFLYSGGVAPAACQ